MTEKGATNTSISQLNEPKGLDQKVSVDVVENASNLDDKELENSLSQKIQLQIREEVEKRFQSAKDKRWDRLEKQVKEMQTNILTTPTSPKDEGTSFDDRAAALLTKVGLDKDVEAKALLNQYLAEGENAKLLPFVEDVLQLVIQSAKPPTASPASLMQPGGGQNPAVSLEKLYEQSRNQLRPGDLLGLLALKRDFRKKGLDVF